MPLTYEFGRGLELKLAKLVNPDFRLTVAKWEAVMKEDNTRGVMEGTDGDGNPLVPVKYRTGIAAPVKRRNRYSKGIGLPLTGMGDNLTTAEYRRLTGPTLAPRGKDSRVIRNYVTRSGFDGTHWFAEGAWINVVDKAGRPFLRYHFDGAGRLPRRDLRGVRPWGQDQARRELVKDINAMLRGQ